MLQSNQSPLYQALDRLQEGAKIEFAVDQLDDDRSISQLQQRLDIADRRPKAAHAAYDGGTCQPEAVSCAQYLIGERPVAVGIVVT